MGNDNGDSRPGERAGLVDTTMQALKVGLNGCWRGQSGLEPPWTAGASVRFPLRRATPWSALLARPGRANRGGIQRRRAVRRIAVRNSTRSNASAPCSLALAGTRYEHAPTGLACCRTIFGRSALSGADSPTASQLSGHSDTFEHHSLDGPIKNAEHASHRFSKTMR